MGCLWGVERGIGTVAEEKKNIFRNNIFIEGLQGSGKTTLLTKIVKKCPDYKAYREGDLSPVELAWCSYMSEEEFQKALERFPAWEEEIRKRTMQEGEAYITAYTLILAEDRAFYEYMESHEIYNGRVDFERFRHVIMQRYADFSGNGNVFECSFFQNSIESMMLFYEMPDEEIVAFYREAFDLLKDKAFKLVYLDNEKIRENLLQIRKERCDDKGNEMWFPLMMGYLKESPYGKSHGCQDMEDLIAHFERRRALELRIIREVIGQKALILKAKQYNDEELKEIK
ncbi:MAG: hypothetical protein IJ282_06770 [Lachnospiraceae bacterium]|nr:hypothetical protein [Lachnospiraceae bacterium]